VQVSKQFFRFAGFDPAVTRILHKNLLEYAGLYLSDFHWGGQSFDWRLATIAGMEVAKLVPWNSLLN